MEPSLRVFVAPAALLTPISRCRTLQELLTALGYGCELLRGALPASQIALKARVQPLRQVCLAEEVYPQRLSLRWRDTADRPTLLLLQQGRSILETGGAMLHLQEAAANAVVLAEGSHDFTITQVPCLVVRMQLPLGTMLHTSSGSSIGAPQAWHADLGLLLPMLRLLEQSLQRAAPAHTRHELGDTLLAYIWDRLAAAGCLVQLPPALADQAGADPVAQLERWLPEHLGQPLELADLAAAVNLSPRRLQELCRQRHGCSPMDLLRQQRLALLARQLRDPSLAGRSLAALMAALQLSDSASTRQAFERAYGCSPAAYRRGAKAVQPA